MHHRTRRDGVSLAEVLIVLLVVAAALIPVYGLLTENARQVSFNADRAVAQILAYQVLERYRLETFDTLRSRFATDDAGAETIREDKVLNELLLLGIPRPMQSLYYKFERSAKFVELEPDHYGQFLCTVSWVNSQRQQRTFVAQAMVRSSAWHYGKN